MPPRQSRPPTLDSLLPPILSLLTSSPPNPYSAHQKALTTTARLVPSGHAQLAIEILFHTSRELLKLGEGGSGAELGVRMVHIMGDAEVEVDEKSRGEFVVSATTSSPSSLIESLVSSAADDTWYLGNAHHPLASVTQLLALTPAHGPWRKKLADSAVKWSAQHGECPTGDPALNQYAGQLYYKGLHRLHVLSMNWADKLLLLVDQSYVLAEQHLLASGKRDAASLLAEMMFDWCEKGQLDPGPYAVRGTLPFLSHRPPSILPAITFLTRFLSLLSSPSCPSQSKFITSLPSQTSFSLPEIQLTTSPTLNFLQLALITIQRAPAPGVSGVQARGLDGGAGREWENLCGRYTRSAGGKGVIGQKEVQEVLGEIATNVFLIPPRGGQQGDLLQSLMGSLFGGGGGGGGSGGGGSRGAIGSR